jgi:hypothetical protein
MSNRRRSEHRRPYFVDRFSAAMWVGVILLLTASMVDAALTIHLLRAGGIEVNPLMNHVLEYGVLPFITVKYVLTAAGLPLLLIFKNYYLFGSRLRVAYLIPITVVLYGGLIAYQLMLMRQHAPL